METPLTDRLMKGPAALPLIASPRVPDPAIPSDLFGATTFADGVSVRDIVCPEGSAEVVPAPAAAVV